MSALCHRCTTPLSTPSRCALTHSLTHALTDMSVKPERDEGKERAADRDPITACCRICETKGVSRVRSSLGWSAFTHLLPAAAVAAEGEWGQKIELCVVCVCVCARACVCVCVCVCVLTGDGIAAPAHATAGT